MVGSAKMCVFFLWSCKLKLVLSCSLNAHPTPMLGSHHFFFIEKDEKMEKNLKKKDTKEVVKCSTNSHNVPELPKPLQVFFALMITMLSLSIFCLRPSLLKRLSFSNASSPFFWWWVGGWARLGGGSHQNKVHVHFPKLVPIPVNITGHTPSSPVWSRHGFAVPWAGACTSVRYRGRLDRHFKTRALVWNLAQFVKNVKEEKNTFKAHLLVSTFPTFALYWLFSMTYFLLLWPF